MIIAYSIERGNKREDFEAGADLADEAFGVRNDPQQMELTAENITYCLEHLPESICVAYEGKKPIGYAFVFPVRQEAANRFIDANITENELFEDTKEHAVRFQNADFIYLCATVVQESHRKNRIAIMCFKKILKRTQSTHKQLLAWPWNEEGIQLVETLAQELDVHLYLRKTNTTIAKDE